ncbi:hypothetical protein PN498_19890 [Oscillatoria sp. CS-180]|uniref:hypothetical protein n=1 Tax=Oscillatoria sp. CS-180 TaxID=3021720 RepID=UPI00232FB812|nr:hypothetical protein [Oscillatoria sp. CS-180]MDB9528264.1 hypothetical protein [Oscillatoria sp. CS-180]
MSQSPKIVHLDILDTDYAKIAAGERISDERKQRLAWGDATFSRLSKQIARYRYDSLDEQGRDDLLCNIATTAGIFTVADMEDINDRLRRTGCFYLTQGERQQVINWLQDELAVNLKVNPDE